MIVNGNALKPAETVITAEQAEEMERELRSLDDGMRNTKRAKLAAAVGGFAVGAPLAVAINYVIPIANPTMQVIAVKSMFLVGSGIGVAVGVCGPMASNWLKHKLDASCANPRALRAMAGVEDTSDARELDNISLPKVLNAAFKAHEHAIRPDPVILRLLAIEERVNKLESERPDQGLAATTGVENLKKAQAVYGRISTDINQLIDERYALLERGDSALEEFRLRRGALAAISAGAEISAEMLSRHVAFRKLVADTPTVTPTLKPKI